MDHRKINFKSNNQNKFKFNLTINWERLLSVTIRVFLLFLVILLLVYIKYRFDLNNYYINHF